MCCIDFGMMTEYGEKIVGFGLTDGAWDGGEESKTPLEEPF